MENFVKILIYFHAFFGGVSLIAGFIAMAVKKGGTIHKKSGIVYFCSMLISGISALIVTVLPNHFSPFLFAVGIFSLFFVITGYRALKFKNQDSKIIIDKWISYLMIIMGGLMIVLPILISRKMNIVLLIFGTIGILLSIRDLVLFKNRIKLKNSWLKLHLIKMIGGYICATTAFIVVNQIIPGIYGWLIPGTVGTFVIFYWVKRTRKPVKGLG